MTRFIQQLLETDAQTNAQGLEFNISSALDHTALTTVMHAQAVVSPRLKHQTDRDRQRRILDTALSANLTLQLSKVDLLDREIYDTLAEAIQWWRPQEGQNTHPYCQQVQKTLLELLPAARRKQQLVSLCREYQEHLRVEVEQYAQRDHEQEFLACALQQTRLFGAPPVAGRPQIKLVSDTRSPVERLAAEPGRYIENPSPALAAALQKYQAVSQLQTALSNPLKPAPAQIEDFRQALQAQRPVLEKDRDSVAMKFVKGVATVLSLGFAWAFGIWEVRGKAAAETMHQVLDAPLASACQSG